MTTRLDRAQDFVNINTPRLPNSVDRKLVAELVNEFAIKEVNDFANQTQTKKEPPELHHSDVIRTTIDNSEYQLALQMANESARIRLHRLNGTDNVWHMRCTPQDAFLTMFDLEELRDMLNIILKNKELNQ